MAGLKLSYEDVPSVFEEAPPQRNGNISSMIWQVAGWNQQSYQFQYDPINRMKKAVYGDILPYTIFDPEAGGSALVLLDDNRYGVDVPEYDPDGNIKWLWRRGMSEFCNDDSTEVKITLIDSLEYFFDPKGRLDSIYDHTLHAKGYYPGITGIEGSFGYDDNGNLINDPYKKLQYTYNIFNLPNGVFTTKGDMGMQYDAESVKLRKTLPNGKVRDYFGEIEYKDQSISLIHHAEGLIRKIGGQYRYDYVISDHLGNARVTFSDFNEDGKIQYLTEIMQENHYYPFGLNMEGLWTYGYGSSLANRFQYNGKERGDEIVLDDPVRDFDVEFGMYDYGARLYDPGIGRFTGVDPLSSAMSSWSTYAYTFDSPINFIDPSGMIPEWVPDKEGNIKSEEGDNSYTLSMFLNIGLNAADNLISQQNLEYTGQNGPAPDLKEGQTLELDNRFTDAITNGADDGTINGKESNCHGCSLSGSTSKVVEGEARGGETDAILNESYNSVDATDAKFGETIIRFGGTNMYAPGESNVNNHTVVFYGRSRDGTNYAFSKPGYASKAEVIKLNNVSNSMNNYGRIRGAKYGQTGYYNPKK
jgi:RHS repeat-associated protein